MNAEVNQALDRISEIHEQLAKADVFRGYRSLHVALSGMVGIVAAALQTRVIGPQPMLSFVYYWTGVAVIAFLVAISEAAYHFVRNQNPHARRRNLLVIGQFMPCLAVGVAVTLACLEIYPGAIPLLPGVWACLFGLGIFSSKPYLPRMMGWIALGYMVAGMVLLLGAANGTSLLPWGMGLTFGIGQVGCAIVLYWNLERKTGEC